ncbi:MAG: TIGR00295 family protein [Candidatus Magnetoovum sp. WYHC-5]|nr:TIGR00295 family protein [Candidatus Magnetoovum sp. WYHC-5]
MKENSIEIETLKKVNCPLDVIAHVEAVTKLALDIGMTVKVVEVDMETLRLGAMYHDIGRSQTHGIAHGVEGVRIARGLGFDEKVLYIIERHIGSGLTMDEARALGLPPKDYLPETVEEKIVAYADNLVVGVKVVTFEEALGRFKRRLGSQNPAVFRFINLHEEIYSWMKL